MGELGAASLQRGGKMMVTITVLSEEQVPRLQIYVEAGQAIDAICGCSEASSASYLLDASPPSLDARVYGLLVYIAAADTTVLVVKGVFNESSGNFEPNYYDEGERSQ
jgi:hypothetical protein